MIQAGTPERASAAIVEQVLTVAAEKSFMTLEQFLQLPAGRARRQRHDDTTVLVAYLEQD